MQRVYHDDVYDEFVTSRGEIDQTSVQNHLTYCPPFLSGFYRFDAVIILTRNICANVSPQKIVAKEHLATARRTNPILHYALRYFEQNPTEAERHAMAHECEQMLGHLAHYGDVTTDTLGVPQLVPFENFLLRSQVMEEIWSSDTFQIYTSPVMVNYMGQTRMEPIEHMLSDEDQVHVNGCLYVDCQSEDAPESLQDFIDDRFKLCVEPGRYEYRRLPAMKGPICMIYNPSGWDPWEFSEMRYFDTTAETHKVPKPLRGNQSLTKVRFILTAVVQLRNGDIRVHDRWGKPIRMGTDFEGLRWSVGDWWSNERYLLVYHLYAGGVQSVFNWPERPQ